MGRLAHGVDIHAVGARAEHASETRGAEFKVFIEAVEDLIVVALDGEQLRMGLLVALRFLEPKLIEFLYIIHKNTPFLYKSTAV